LVFLSLIFPSMARAVTVGFYAGTFDPPTLREMAMVRCAFGDASIHKECPDIGKKISRVVVVVNQADDEDPLASARERVLMVKKALQKYGDRAEIGTANSEEKARSLLADGNVEQLIRFVDEESYKAARSAPLNQDPRLLWIVVPIKQAGNSSPVIDPKNLPPNVKLLSGIEQLGSDSSTAVQKAIQTGGTMEGLFGPAVKEVIERLGLYQPVSEDLAVLQKSLFDESWKGFSKDLKSACPSVSNQKECADLASAWESISIASDDSMDRTDIKKSSANVLIYKRAQSADRWAEKFTEIALKPLQGSARYAQFKAVAEDMSSKIYEGYPDDKLFYLRKVFVPKPRPSMEPLKISQKPASCSPPRGPYHMDIVDYTSDRFPLSFAAFLREQFRKRSISPRELYVHNQAVEPAYEFHRRDGFDTLYFLQTRRGQLHRDIYLAVRTKPLNYRVVFTNVRGRDQEADVFCQIYHSGTFSSFHRVQATPGLRLFAFNRSGSSLKLNDKDWLLFGFKGKWTKILLEQGWQLQPLVNEGLDIGLFTHPTIKQRLVVARNVYGDDANIVLDTFYKKGIRQVVYLGTSGAIAGYQVGDVTIPDEVIDNKNSVPFRRNLAHAYAADLSNRVTVHEGTKHGWVQTVYQETLALLLDWKSRSVAAMDVEGIYLARLSRSHDDLKMSAFFVISDQTLGDSTIGEDESHLNIIDESVYKLVAFLLPRILPPN